MNDYVFINFNYGIPSRFKRGQSPIFFEMLKANYSGSDPLTSLIVNDKSFSKKIVKDKVNTPKSTLVFSEKDTERIRNVQWHFPIIVKPNSEGSSLGISDNSLCNSVEKTINISKELLRDFSPVIVEEYIEGFEVTVWIIGNENNYRLIQPLVVSIDNKYYFEKKIFTATDKANHIRKYSLPSCVFSSQLIERIIRNSLLIFEELGIRDYGRIDFRINNNEVYFIEANALPFFSKSSEIGAITKLCNISYNSICKMIFTYSRFSYDINPILLSFDIFIKLIFSY